MNSVDFIRLGKNAPSLGLELVKENLLSGATKMSAYYPAHSPNTTNEVILSGASSLRSDDHA
jgi:hypothetical protein